MAVSTRTYVRQRDFSKLFIALAVLAAVVAVAPIGAAILGYGTSAVSPKTAFATAPAGDYAVLGRSDGQADVISVAWAANPGAVTEVARVPHIEGFASTGAVSPDSKHVALVSVDGGSATHPTASLNVVGLDTGLVTRAAADVMPGQTPVWTADGSRIVAVRMVGAADGASAVRVIEVSTSGKDERTVAEYKNVLGAYPIGFASTDKLATVVIDSRGSTLMVGDSVWGPISAGITRDWKLSPDGTQLAFIETVTDGGVRYLAQTVSLAPGSSVNAQSLSTQVSALGTAWNPASQTAMFGIEPGGTPGVSAQSLSAGTADGAGFDVPMGFSRDGANLLVTRWSGASFEAPGKPVLQIVNQDGRTNYDTFTRFYGWASR